MNINTNKLPISHLLNLYKTKLLNLEPPYQRKPVWTYKQRVKLLSSIFNGIPIPPLIFKNKYNNKGKLIFDVIDGKQRIETTLDYVYGNILEGKYLLYAFVANPDNNKEEQIYFKDLKDKNLFEKFMKYELTYIQFDNVTDFYDNQVADFDIFVKINSTGTKLTPGEIKWAQRQRPFAKLAAIIHTKPIQNLFSVRWKIFNQNQINRYQLFDFILELCTAIHEGNFIDRKKKLNKLLEFENFNKRELNIIKIKFFKTIKWIKGIFPFEDDLKITRFKNKSEFYSLFVVLVKLINKGYVTDNHRSNKLAQSFLNNFSLQINNLVKQKNFNVLSHPENSYKNYLESTYQATDSKTNREIRDTYLTNILKDGIFIKKDSKRNFSKTDRDIIWLNLYKNHRNGKIKCPNPRHNRKCNKILTYDTAQIDHKWAWSKGGPTSLENAKLLCPSCNANKGNR